MISIIFRLKDHIDYCILNLYTGGYNYYSICIAVKPESTDVLPSVSELLNLLSDFLNNVLNFENYVYDNSKYTVVYSLKNNIVYPTHLWFNEVKEIVRQKITKID